LMLSGCGRHAEAEEEVDGDFSTPESTAKDTGRGSRSRVYVGGGRAYIYGGRGGGRVWPGPSIAPVARGGLGGAGHAAGGS
jgi:hypothetical protein